MLSTQSSDCSSEGLKTENAGRGCVPPLGSEGGVQLKANTFYRRQVG